MSNGNRHDAELEGVFAARERDWRNGAVIYQVLVDRFAPPASIDAKRHLYPAPKLLRRWNELPQRGRYIAERKLWSHEIEFWGGDLQSLQGRLDHLQQLGAEVLYLNPIHLAYTNHKYDALDHAQLSPEYGTREHLRALAAELHGRGMRLVLDGVFNHMGRNAQRFREAEADPASRWRDWFVFGPEYAGGARCWWRAENLPELNLENPAVRAHLYEAQDSVVRSFPRDGADGWRLDVAFDIGLQFLGQLTRAAHAEKAGSLVVGEIPNYPKEWFPAVDAVMQFALRRILIGLVDGRIEAATAGRMIERLIGECGIEPMLKSWVLLDNHDTQRLATAVPDAHRRRLAQVLQFTLPGAPNLYYGSEVEMTGGDDPEMRAPMRWDLVEREHPALAWTMRLIALRRSHRALRIGDFRPITSHHLLAFERFTNRVQDTVLVVANPADHEVAETVMVANSKLMDGTRMLDLLGTHQGGPIVMHAALLSLRVPARSALVLQPETRAAGGYSNYKRVL